MYLLVSTVFHDHVVWEKFSNISGKKKLLLPYGDTMQQGAVQTSEMSANFNLTATAQPPRRQQSSQSAM
jgi:hypothetical protein